MKTLSLKLTPIAMVLAMLTACGGDKPAQTAEKAPEANKAAKEPAGTVYNVGVEAPYPPYIQLDENGVYEGFDIDILEEIGKREGFTVQYQAHPWDGILDKLPTGELDIVASGVFDTPERRSKYGMTDAYHQETVVVVAGKDSTLNNFNDIKGKKVAYVPGSYSADVLQKMEGKELDPALAVNGSWPAIQGIIQKKNEFALDTSSAFEYYSKQYPDQGLRGIYPENPEWLNIAFATKQDNTELLGKLNKGIAAIKSDGTYDKIKSKWFSANAVTPTTTIVNGAASAPAAATATSAGN